MTTRKSSNLSTYRQERYASNDAFNQTLLLNIVAQKAGLFTSRKQRIVLYMLQQLSIKDPGLTQTSEEIVRMFGHRVGTSGMLEVGLSEEYYEYQDAFRIREEIPWTTKNNNPDARFPLRGDSLSDVQGFSMADLVRESFPSEEELEDIRRQELELPIRYKVSAFLDLCKDQLHGLQKDLIELCINPDFGWDDFWYFADIMSVLLDYKRYLDSKNIDSIAPTSVSKQIDDALEYALAQRLLNLEDTDEQNLVVVEGDSRIGKSVSTRNWCSRHHGEAVYVLLEQCNDEKSFFRIIAKAIGTSSSAGRKTAEIKHRIEDALQSTKQLVVFDEAHFVFGHTRRPTTEPKKLEWIRTALINKGVPVAFVCTPQWDSRMKIAESTGWNSKQLKGRIGHRVCLGAKLSECDIEMVVRHLYTFEDERVIKLLQGVAFYFDEQIAQIQRVIKRAKFFAMKEGVETPEFNHFYRVYNELVATEPESTSGPRTRTAKVFHDRCKSPAIRSERILKRADLPMALAE